MRNFQEVDPGMTKQEALKRQIAVFIATMHPVLRLVQQELIFPTFIKKIASGNVLGSAKTIMAANPVGASCSRVCPTEELCEGACVLNHSTKPIMIGNLQRYATDWAIKNEQVTI